MTHGVSNGRVTDDVRFCEAVRSAILATVWLLVCYGCIIVLFAKRLNDSYPYTARSPLYAMHACLHAPLPMT